MEKREPPPSPARGQEAGLEYEDLLAVYLDRLNDGEFVDPAQILADHPASGERLLDDLAAFIGSHPREAPLGTLGDYTLRRQIGRGGMGIVYDAWQNSMDRRVALKVLPAGIAADDRAYGRFMREARAAGKLSHPNVVAVHASGQDAKTPYFAMEFIEGETLAQILARARAAGDREEEKSSILQSLSQLLGKSARTKSVAPEDGGRRDVNGERAPKETEIAYYHPLAEAFAGVADGLQHAHARGIVHRDIKPSNLILDTKGCLRILDFGLARLEGQESLTASGDLVGTPLYMSPEQARARKVPIDHRTDVYSLGATLYEMLAWRPPFRGNDHQDTLSQIIDRDPVEPRRMNPRVPRDLELIVLKCLRKEPGDRYGTAEALGQDLRRFIRGDFVEAKPPEKWKKWVRWAVRNRWRAALGGVAALALILCGLAYHFYSESRRKTTDVLDSPSASVSDPISWLKDSLKAVGAQEAADGLWRILETGEEDSGLWTIWLALTLNDLGCAPADLLEKVRSLGAHEGNSRATWAERLLRDLAEGNLLRINCGYCYPSEDLELDGEVWSNDCFFRGGIPGPGRKSVAITGTDKPALYRTARGWGVTGGYSIPVPAGRYAVRLHFAQTRETKPGKRVYDVYVDGKLVLRDYDTLVSVGFGKADIREFAADVRDGILDISFKTAAGYSVVAAIEVERLK